jgi:hypothetical protein
MPPLLYNYSRHRMLSMTGVIFGHALDSCVFFQEIAVTAPPAESGPKRSDPCPASQASHAAKQEGRNLVRSR